MWNQKCNAIFSNNKITYNSLAALREVQQSMFIPPESKNVRVLNQLLDEFRRLYREYQQYMRDRE